MKELEQITRFQTFLGHLNDLLQGLPEPRARVAVDAFALEDLYDRKFQELAESWIPSQCFVYMAQGKKIAAIKELRDFSEHYIKFPDGSPPIRFTASLKPCKDIIDNYWEHGPWKRLHKEGIIYSSLREAVENMLRDAANGGQDWTREVSVTVRASLVEALSHLVRQDS